MLYLLNITYIANINKSIEFISSNLQIDFCINRYTGVKIECGGDNMIVDYVAIGRKIKNKRKNKGLTQERIAEQLDISISFVSRIERGAVKVSLETLVKIANCLDELPTYFLDGSVKKNGLYLKAELAEIVVDFIPEKMKLLVDIAKSIEEYQL